MLRVLATSSSLQRVFIANRRRPSKNLQRPIGRRRTGGAGQPRPRRYALRGVPRKGKDM